MKKLLFTLIILLGSTLAWAGNPAKVRTLINEYRHQDGFETISIGPLGMSLMRTFLRHSDEVDKEDLEVLRCFDSIRKLTIVDYEDAEVSVRERFNQKLKRLLKEMELILEAKDDGERLSIYGVEENGRVKDCILYSPDGTLLCVKGSINMEKLMEYSNR